MARFDDTQGEARALGDPTRYSLFRYIVESDHEVGVGELTDFVRLNHNAVRQHLALLSQSGLVEESIEQRDRPGRPRLFYRIHPDVAGKWGTSGPYEWLSGVLARALAEQLDPRTAGFLEGNKISSKSRKGVDPIDLLHDEMRARGFRPTRKGKNQQIEFVLERCPFAQVAENNPEMICKLHLGYSEGLVQGSDEYVVSELIVKNPQKAGCRLILEKS